MDKNIECVNCGCILESDEVCIDHNNYIDNEYCQTCFDDLFFFCETCQDFHSTDDMIVIDDEMYCETCADRNFYKCWDCGEYINSCDSITIFNGETVCHDCYHSNYFTCCECDEVYPDEYSNSHDNGTICDDCLSSIQSQYINDYGYKPSAIFHGMGRKFGVECEIETPYLTEMADTLYQHSNSEKLFYLKEDGSLSHGRGVEIVSHPMDIDYHKKIWSDVCRVAEYVGVDDMSSCGLHVHVEKKAFTNDLSIALLIMLVNKFIDKDRSELTIFSRRNYRDLESWSKKTSIKFSSIDDMLSEHRQWGRYTAVNIWNKDTVEIRIFNGTVDYQTIIASIQMVDSLVEYVNTQSIYEIMSCSWIDFLLHTDFTNRPELKAELQRLNIWLQL